MRAVEGGCQQCDAESAVLEGVVRVGAYAGGCAELVQSLKYGGWWELAKPLGRRLGWALRAQLGAGLACEVVVVPMPSTLRRRLKRGFNPAGLIADAAAIEMRAVRARLLWRSHGRAQAGRSRSARLAMTARGWHVYPRARKLLRGRSVILIDDVLTTGRSVRIAGGFLQRAGAASVQVGVVAVTENKKASFDLIIPR
ncbi:MAG: ComF family protein [Planctomycetes bacterium]|nr:ComF family protein [Planctomycetota bacterium]MCP4838508.1 ComF family protein [Planctomycetota bacterium]